MFLVFIYLQPIPSILIISYKHRNNKVWTLLSALNLFRNGDELTCVQYSFLKVNWQLHRNIGNNYMLYFSDISSLSRVWSWCGERAQYSENVHKKNGFSQV